MPLILIPPYRFSALATAVLAAYGVDPYYDQVVYLNHFDGTNGYQTFKDVVGHRVTFTGSVVTSTSSYKVGTSSAYFNGQSGSNILSKSADYVLGTDDFTIEFWGNWSVLGAGQTSRGLFQLSSGANGGFLSSATNSIAIGSARLRAGRMEVYLGNQGIDTGWTPVAGRWYHFAIVRKSGTSTVYVDGQTVASVADTVNYTGDTLGLGSYWDATTACLQGYLDEMRITKGVARYTTNFTPTTTAFANKRSERTFKLNSLTSQNVSPSFLDASSSNVAITTTGKPSQGVYSPFSSDGWSARFNGSTDYLRIQPVAPALNNYSSFGTQNWSVEGWYTFDDIVRGDDQTLFTIGHEAWGGATPYIRLVYNANGQAAGFGRLWAEEANSSAGLWNLGNPFDPVPGRPYHIVICRYDGVIRIYINGSEHSTRAYASAHQDFPTLTIGAMYYRGGNQQYLAGAISGFRVRVGEAYSGSFTTPTTMPTVTAGTKALLAYNGAYSDGGPMNYEVKVGGAPAMLQTSPFAPVTYSAATHGGAVYFDGVTDRLGFAANSAFNLSSGTFTMSMWMNPLSAPAAGNLCRFFLSGTNGWGDAFTLQMHSDLSVSAQIPLGGVSVAKSSAGAIKLGVWQHVEFACSAGQMRIFVNGRLVGGPTAITVPAANDNLTAFMGYEIYGTVDHKFKGWISDFRITNTADHTAMFSVPTAPSAANANTKLKLNFTNGSMVDEFGGTTLVPVGNVALAGNKKAAGSYAISLDGASYVQAMNGTSAYGHAAGVGPGDFGTDDFTISFWMNSSQAPTGWKSAIGTQTIAGAAVAGMWRVATSWNSTAGLYFHYTANGSFVVGEISNINLHDGKWHHLTIVRSAGSVKAYVDGVQTGNTLSVPQSLTSNKNLMIGYQAQDGSYWTGQIDDIEITRNGAMYTSNFTVPNKSTHIDSFAGTWDPAWNTNTLSNGNLTAYIPGNGTARSTNRISSGAAYVEVTYTTAHTTLGPIIGIMKANNTGYAQAGTASVWVQDRYGHAMLANGTDPLVELGTNLGFYEGDKLGIKIDMSTSTVKFYKNGVAMGGSIGITAGEYYIFASSPGGQYPVTVTADFSQTVIPA
jgi:hypothetical protein